MERVDQPAPPAMPAFDPSGTGIPDAPMRNPIMQPVSPENGPQPGK